MYTYICTYLLEPILAYLQKCFHRSYPCVLISAHLFTTQTSAMTTAAAAQIETPRIGPFWIANCLCETCIPFCLSIERHRNPAREALKAKDMAPKFDPIDIAKIHPVRRRELIGEPFAEEFCIQICRRRVIRMVVPILVPQILDTKEKKYKKTGLLI